MAHGLRGVGGMTEILAKSIVAAQSANIVRKAQKVPTLDYYDTLSYSIRDTPLPTCGYQPVSWLSIFPKEEDIVAALGRYAEQHLPSLPPTRSTLPTVSSYSIPFHSYTSSRSAPLHRQDRSTQKSSNKTKRQEADPIRDFPQRGHKDHSGKSEPTRPPTPNFNRQLPSKQPTRSTVKCRDCSSAAETVAT